MKYPRNINQCDEEQLQHFINYVNNTYIIEEDRVKTLYHSFLEEIEEEGFEVQK